MFLNVYYVPGMKLNLLSVSQIMRHCPHLAVNFSNHKCYIVDKETKKTIALGVEVWASQLDISLSVGTRETGRWTSKHTTEDPGSLQSLPRRKTTLHAI